MVNNPFNFFNSVLEDNFFFDNLNFFDGWNLDFNFDYLFDNSRYFNNLLDSLNKRDRLFDTNLNNFWDFLDMIYNFSSVDWFY